MGDLVEQVADQRCADVVREVGDERPAACAVGSSSVVQSVVIASASTTATLSTPDSSTIAASTGTTPRSTSTAVMVGAGLGQRERERPEPGADLDDVVAGADPCEFGDAPHGVRVGDEVLTEIAARREAVIIEQFVDRRARVGHVARPS